MKSLLARLRSHRLASTFVLLATVSAAIIGGSFAAHGVRGQERTSDSTDATPLKVSSSPTEPNAFVKIAKAVGPAVVNINTQTLPKAVDNKNRRPNPHTRVQPNPQAPGDDDDDQTPGQGQAPGQGQPDNNFQDFFNRFFGGQAPDGEGGDDGQVRESLGSGFIVDPKGYIITNNHVIEKADKIYVKLSTDPDSQDLGRPARVIGTDKATDLAVIKIETNSPLPIVKMGNSDQAQVGDWVEAIGSPFALAQTVTAGIVSAKNRTIEPGVAGQFQHFIQTDAAINPGNSGGPLLNMNGEVIGVNTAIYTQSAGYQGIGFAMPANTVVAVYNDLISPSPRSRAGRLVFPSALASLALSTASTDSRTAFSSSRCSPADPLIRAASSPETSSPASTAAQSRMATTWSATSPAADPAQAFVSDLSATENRAMPPSLSATATRSSLK